MNAFNSIWKNYTTEFSTVQKIVIAVVLGFILFVALMAVFLLIMEFSK